MNIKAETAEEIDQIQSIAGMRERIVNARLFDPLVNKVLRVAELNNLSEEETYVFLAYHALVIKEDLHKTLLEYLQWMPIQPLVVSRTGSTD